MKTCDFIINDGRIFTVLPVTSGDIAKGVDVAKPGKYMFSGQWYGRSPFDIDSYGKVMSVRGRVSGRIRNESQLIRLKSLVEITRKR